MRLTLTVAHNGVCYSIQEFYLHDSAGKEVFSEHVVQLVSSVLCSMCKEIRSAI